MSNHDGDPGDEGVDGQPKYAIHLQLFENTGDGMRLLLIKASSSDDKVGIHSLFGKLGAQMQEFIQND